MSPQDTLPITETPEGLDEAIKTAENRAAFMAAVNAKIERALHLQVCPHCHGRMGWKDWSERTLQHTHGCKGCKAEIVSYEGYLHPGMPKYRTTVAPQFTHAQRSAFADILKNLEDEYGITTDKP